MMFRKKVYGESRLPSCPFCGKNAIAKNAMGIPVCEAHRSADVPPLKCACGLSLDLRTSKWGPYGFCESCGNISWTKLREINRFDRSVAASQSPSSPAVASIVANPSPSTLPYKIQKKTTESLPPPPSRVSSERKPSGPREITIRSDELDFL